ncbi:MAG: large conductance mechanosensitive channel protein MscL [Planctomycetota bacterium]
MGLISEFKEFAMKGNVVDMAVGVVIGGAFGKIVGSMVNDVIMPVVGAMTGGVDFSQRFLWLGEGDTPATLDMAREAGGAYLGWGPFLQNTIDFLIVAAAIFVAIKAMNSMQKKEEEAPKEPPEDIVLLREIRDGLAK